MPGPDDRDHQLYRSHFPNAGDHDGPSSAPAGDSVEPVEKEVANGWLNIRGGNGDWASVRELSRVRTDRTQQGRIPDAAPPTEETDRPSYADPVADGMDPTAPDSPESAF